MSTPEQLEKRKQRRDARISSLKQEYIPPVQIDPEPLSPPTQPAPVKTSISGAPPPPQRPGITSEGVYDPNYIPQTEEEATNVADEYTRNKWLQNFYKKQGMDFDAKQPGSFEDSTMEFLTAQKETKSDLEKQLSVAAENARKSLGQDVGALKSRFSAGREGAASASDAQLKKDVVGSRVQAYESQYQDIESKKREIEALQQQQQKSYLSSRADRILSLRKEAADAEAALTKASADSRKETMSLLGQLTEAGALAGLGADEISYLESVLPDAPPGVIGLFSQAATKKGLSDEKKATLDNQSKALGMMKDLVSQGVTMTPELLQNFANQSGLPLESLFNFNKQAMSVMNDKNLDQATKAAQLQKLGLELDRQSRGITNAELEKVDYIENLYKSGASPDEIARAKRVIGLKDEDDPMYQADLALKQSQAAIEQKKLRGEPVTMDDQLKFLEAQQMKASLGGYGPQDAYVPVAPLNGIKTEFKDGKLNIASDAAMQCGEAVNRTWGLGSGDDGGFGDTLKSKLALVNGERGVKVADVTDIMSQIKPGMAFVTNQSQYGHVGIVTQVFPDGHFTTSEANIGDNNVNTPDPLKEGSRSITDGDLQGFVKPPDGQFKLEGTGQQGSVLLRVPKDARTAVTTKANQFDGEQQVRSFQTLQNVWNKAQGVNNETENPADDQALVYAFAKAMDPSSAVKEGEYETIQQNAQSRLTRWGVTAKRFYSESTFLTPEAREGIKKAIKNAYDQEKGAYKTLRDGYIKTINNYAGMPVGEEILQDYSFEGDFEKPQEETPQWVNWLQKFSGQAEDPENDFASFDTTSGEDILNEFQ